MPSSYTLSSEELKQIRDEIAQLEYRQSQLQERLQTNSKEYKELEEKIEKCNKKLSEYNNIQSVFENFKYKAKEVKRRIKRKALKFGIPGLVLSWFIGGAIANSVIGAILGVSLVVATSIGSSLAYYHRKVKDDKEIMSNNKLSRIKRKITNEEALKEVYLEKKNTINADNATINRVYAQNKARLEELRLTESIFSPSSQNQKKPYSKKYATQ